MLNSFTWWRHQMETFSASLAFCAGNSPVSGKYPTQRPVTRSFDVFFDLRLIQWLTKHSRGWWFETPSRPSWCRCNESRRHWQQFSRGDICQIWTRYSIDIQYFNIHSGAIITRSNNSWYSIQQCIDYINQSLYSQRHPISRPNWRAMGSLLWGFERKLSAL